MTEPGQDRRFYKTEYRVVVITEKPFLEDVSLHDIHMRMIQGDCAGDITIVDTVTLDAAEAAKELVIQNCDPAIFGIRVNGLPFEGDEIGEEGTADDSAAATR